jgi:hypothetical protein
VADIETQWTWNLSGRVSSSKASSRPSLPKETAWDLVGFDGNSPGGLRTHAGFKLVDSFTPVGTVVNVFPVTVLRGSTGYTYGYVYVREVGTTTTYYTLRAWRTDTSVFETVELHNIAAINLEVDVQAIGRFIYLFARGYDPAMCYLSTSSAITRTLVSPAGQGTAPVASLTAGQDLHVVKIANSTTETSTNILTAGYYGFAIQYMDTVTGRKSQISNTVTILLVNSFNEVQYTVKAKSGYDKALIYRTVNQGKSSSTYSGAPMHLEAIQTVPGSGTTDFTVTNKDRSLVYKDVYVDRGTLETTMPKGGVAQFLDGTLFISRISGAPTIPSETTPLAPPSGLGELRWSSLLETLPENFNPFNRWIPQTPSNEILGMRKVGSFMIGFGQDRIYHIRRQGAYCRLEEMHPGYGLAARYGMESIGNLIYFISNRGLKAISSEGQVDDVSGLNQILNDQWVDSISTVQMAYDAPTMCLYTLRPTTSIDASGHAVCMWFSTSCMTELVDLPFSFVRGGSWLNSTTGTLERRSLFFTKASSSAGTPITTTPTNWNVYIPETSRPLDQAPTYPNTTNKHLLGGEATIGVAQYAVPSEAANQILVSAVGFGGELWGTAAYVIKSPTGLTPIGTRIRLSSQSDLNTLAKGDLVSLAPVYMQWTGANIGASQDPNMDGYKEFFRTKQVSSCRAYVEYNANLCPPVIKYPVLPYSAGVNIDATPFWMARLFRGANNLNLSDHTPIASSPLAGPAFPGSFSETQSPTACFGLTVDPESVPAAPFGKHGVVYSSLSPSWTCFWPGADITLLAFSAKGKILDTEKRFL